MATHSASTKNRTDVFLFIWWGQGGTYMKLTSEQTWARVKASQAKNLTYDCRDKLTLRVKYPIGWSEQDCRYVIETQVIPSHLVFLKDEMQEQPS